MKEAGRRKKRSLENEEELYTKQRPFRAERKLPINKPKKQKG